MLAALQGPLECGEHRRIAAFEGDAVSGSVLGASRALTG
jgi:hypothetical protein